MIIRDMFAEDINRYINGVVQVEEDTESVIEQEVREYVITKELKKHFRSFFDAYCEAYDQPSADIGVWISGFFGSGKSHFLKMISYILENKSIDGVKTAERFRAKFEDDPAAFMPIDRATRGRNETIRFNIDVESPVKKDKTAVLRVFAKVFYDHLGYYGGDLRVALLEQYIEQQGKTEAFIRAFEQRKGSPWIANRRAFAFNGKYIVPALVEALDMSEKDAEYWFYGNKSEPEFSISRLVEDIKAYVADKPADFRLIFMADEVGQYIGTDTDLLLNLQSIVEKIGSECRGKVWVVCTGQEAIDEIIKVRNDEFSRIQARFKTRLSLSSSSVDEVIQKRILKKMPEAKKKLESLYDANESVLRNLFSFSTRIMDIKGYKGADEFAADFPFVPYQLVILPKVFSEVRKHGNAGKHFSGRERSMLSGFQEAAKAVQGGDEYSLVPFYRFYDTARSFLDSNISNVIERCQRAADESNGIEPQDVNVLKLLYLLRYINEDIPATLDNIVILMADDIRADKIVMRQSIRGSLDHLLSQNYIGRAGDTFNFLTDEEQDIQREIRDTHVDTSTIIERLGHIIFSDIYTTRKYTHGIYNFDFDKMVDGVTVGNISGGMKLRFLTAATPEEEKSELRLLTESVGQAIAVLPESKYYENMESALRIDKFVKQRNILHQPKSVQKIIQDQQEQATKYKSEAEEQLRAAIEKAEFYVDGEHLTIKSGDAKSRIEQALGYLVSHVYGELGLITKNASSDDDIRAILSGTDSAIPGMEPNRDAAAKVEEFLVMQERKRLPTSMADIQSRYQSVPYGWRDIDVAAVVALLIYKQKVTIKYGGATIQPTDAKLPEMLRKKTEIGKTAVSRRQSVNAAKMKLVKSLLREYFGMMAIPDDEDGLVAFIVERFVEQRRHYEELNAKYSAKRLYPDQHKVQNAISLMDDILSQQRDNIALIDRVLKCENRLYDTRDDMQDVESFFKNQVQVFDAAAKMEEDLANELDYLSREPEANSALNQIRLITKVQGNFNYRKIPELNKLMATVRAGHERLLEAKREEVRGIVTQCLGAIHEAADGCMEARDAVERADNHYTHKCEQISELKSLALLDALVPQMLQYKDDACAAVEQLKNPPPPQPKPEAGAAQPKKIIKSYNRQIVFPSRRLESEADVDAYVEQVRSQLKQLIKNCDGIEIK